MTASRRRFSQEFQDELCRAVISPSKPIREIAEPYGVGTETLRNWLINYRDDDGGTVKDLPTYRVGPVEGVGARESGPPAETAFLTVASAGLSRRSSGSGSEWSSKPQRKCLTMSNGTSPPTARGASSSATSMIESDAISQCVPRCAERWCAEIGRWPRSCFPQ